MTGGTCNGVSGLLSWPPHLLRAITKVIIAQKSKCGAGLSFNGQLPRLPIGERGKNIVATLTMRSARSSAGWRGRQPSRTGRPYLYGPRGPAWDQAWSRRAGG
jgi:hypothetical protein